MPTATALAGDETRIRGLVEDWAQALRDKDVDAVMTHYAPDVIAFDLAPPLQHDRDAMRKGLEAWFPTFKGRIGYEITGLRVAAGEDVAFAHSLNHMTGARTDGTQTDVWFRATVCFHRAGGAWKVAHEHASVPFYMDGSLKAAVDLKP
jgi:PhnB protein